MTRTTVSCPPDAGRRWPLERALFALAGTVTLLSAGLAAVVSPWFLLLTAFVGVNQWLFVVLGACPTSFLLVRVLGLSSQASQTTQTTPGASR